MEGGDIAEQCHAYTERRVLEYAALVAGGSLAAARALVEGRHRIAAHFDGGRHHAHKSRAAGFCYVNDVVS